MHQVTIVFSLMSGVVGVSMSLVGFLIIRARIGEDEKAEHSAACFLPMVGLIICLLSNGSWRRDRGATICLLAGAVLVIGSLRMLTGR